MAHGQPGARAAEIRYRAVRAGAGLRSLTPAARSICPFPQVSPNRAFPERGTPETGNPTVMKNYQMKDCLPSRPKLGRRDETSRRSLLTPPPPYPSLANLGQTLTSPSFLSPPLRVVLRLLLLIPLAMWSEVT